MQLLWAFIGRLQKPKGTAENAALHYAVTHFFYVVCILFLNILFVADAAFSFVFSSDFNMDFSDSDFSEEEDAVSPSVSAPPVHTPVVTGKKHLKDLKNMLKLDSYQAKLDKKRRKRKAAKARKMGLTNDMLKEGIIKTMATKTLNLTNVPEIVTFVDHKKRKRSNQDDLLSNPDVKRNAAIGKEVTMKEARFEVFKFGVSGMDKKSKEEANTALALRLGAKPEKNKCLDYKDLKEERRLEKEEKDMMEEERKQSLQGVRKSSNKNKLVAKKSSKRVKKKGSKSDFKVGSFNGGMLKLSQKDLSSIKRK